MMELKRYFVEMQVSVTAWVQVYASDSDTAAGLADAAASNLDLQFVTRVADDVRDGDYTCEPYETLEAKPDEPFVKGLLTISEVHAEQCGECGLPATECSFGGYEVVNV
jgi:hypothetical protein